MKIILEDSFGWPIEVLVEDFKTASAAFQKQGADKEAIKKVLELFKSLRDSHRIKDQEQKNIDHWAKGSFEDLKSFVQSLSSTQSKTQTKAAKKQEGSELVAENDDWLVYRITSKNACISYGSGTKWCITSRKSSHWEDYSKSNNFYFIISKALPDTNEFHKIAMMVDSKGKKTFFDASDQEYSKFPASGKLPHFGIEIPEYKIEVNGELMTLSHFQSSKGLKVDGDLNLNDTPITSLPADLKVGGGLGLSYTKITSLPDGFKVDGHLDLRHTKITSLPAGLKVGGGLGLSYTKITSLPADLKVYGNLYLNDTKITSLPADLKVYGNLYLSGTKIKDKDVPDHLKKKVVR